jgi:hypothetical protein
MSFAVVLPIARPGEVLQGGHGAAWNDFGALFLSPIKYIIALKTLRPRADRLDSNYEVSHSQSRRALCAVRSRNGS